MQPVIICVDDDETILSTLKEQLKSNLDADYIIELAESGQEALEIVEEFLEDGIEVPVFITDQIMPGLNGDDLLKQVHLLLPKTLKILLTGQASADAVGNAVNYAGLYRYIGKPWDEIDLIMTVKEAIRSFFQDKTLTEKNRELEALNRELQEKVETFYRFVPSQFLEILKHKSDFERIELGASTECDMTVMFSDIRSFTKLSEKFATQDIFNFLNSYLSHMGPIIRKHSGFIDKYIGDSIMGLFERPDYAVNAGIEMLSHLYKYNEGRVRAGYLPIKIGIGINNGPLTLGTIGENNRMETTVIGEVVNLASRIEKLTKIFSTPLIISEYTFKDLADPGRYHIRFIDRVKVKGIQNRLAIYEVFDSDLPMGREAKLKYMDVFEEGISLYNNQEFENALKCFEECLRLNPRDGVVRVYINRCRRLPHTIDDIDEYLVESQRDL